MTRQLSHEDYTVGWVCALPVEMAAAQEMLDEEHPDLDLADNDENLYALGSISGHNVVIVCLPAGRIGNNPAASVATQMRATFKKIQFGLMVGIGGGVPSAEADVRLGDIVVSQPSGQSAGVVQYDMGKTTPSGFERTGSLNSPPQILLAAVARVKANQLRGKSNLAKHISKLESIAHFQRSRAGPDILFEAAYDHIGGQTCDECSPNRHQVRPARDIGEEVIVHYGTIASGNQVLRSATERDKVSTEFGKVLCFEMEAAGLMNSFPCLVVRGICDYADSHKNKRWQPFAAGTAAAYAKEVLSMIPPAELVKSQTAEEVVKETNGNLRKPTYHIPFLINRRFVGRKAELQLLQQRLMVNRDCQELSIVGLGGTGKTQVALQFAYSVKEKWPEYSIFWVPTLSMEGFEQACVSIARALGLPQVTNDKEDVKEQVKRYLSSSQAGQWLMVVDNADDPSILFETAESLGVVDYLPKNDTGVVVYTTRTMDVAVSLTQSDVLELQAMNRQDAIDFFSKSLIRKEILCDHHMTNKLLDELTCLPLAIAQAAAYLNMNRTTIAKYLQLLHSTEQDLIRLLSREFRDNTRYKGSANAVATTWVVSFTQLREHYPSAADLLEFISCIEWKAIPQSLLPERESKEQMETAIGTLCGYSFLVRRDIGNQSREVEVGEEEGEGEEEEGEGEEEEEEWYDIHRLVHLATQIWVKNNNLLENVVEDAIKHVMFVFPGTHYNSRATWRAYLPHALRLLDMIQNSSPKGQSALCQRVGSCLLEDGRFREAVTWLERSIHLNSRLIEDDIHRTLPHQTLATAYIKNGQTKKAIALLERIVKVKEALALDNPSRLASQHTLAIAYQEDGQVRRAIELLEHVVKVEETLAPDDPSRLASQYMLAAAYQEDGQVRRAIELLEHVVKMEETLAPGDPTRLASQHMLATAYQVGQLEKAIPLLEYVIRLQDKVLGPEHPDQLMSQYELAVSYRRGEQIPKAIELLEYVIRLQGKVLGPEHPDLLTSQSELAVAYRKVGQAEKAKALLEHIVRLQDKVLGPEHPDLLVSQYELAIAYKKEGQIQKAMALLEHVVRIEEKTLKSEHPDLITSQHSLALVYDANGQTEKAIALLEHVVAVRARTLQADHSLRVGAEEDLADMRAMLAIESSDTSSDEETSSESGESK